MPPRLALPRAVARAGAGSPTLALYEGVDELRTFSDTSLLMPARLAPAAAGAAPAAGASAGAAPSAGPAAQAIDHLERSAASPSAVYHARLVGTPFQRVRTAGPRRTLCARLSRLARLGPCTVAVDARSGAV
jgi:hypothetical protein